MSDSISSQKGFEAWFVNNPIAANLLMIVLIGAGLLSAISLNTEEFPSMDPRAVSVGVVFPGATPSDVEEGVVLPIEQAMLGLAGVERVHSYAYEGYGSVILDVATFADIEKIRDEAQTVVDGVRRFLPDNAEEPTVTFSSQSYSVVTLAVIGDVAPLALKGTAQDLERALLSAPGISMVSIMGARETEIVLEIDETQLQAFGLSFDEIAVAVRAGSIDASAGELRTQGGNILLRTDERRTSVEALGEIVLRAEANGQRITLADVVTIREDFVRDEMTNSFNGRPAILVQIMRSADQDLIDVKKAVDTFLGGYRPPAGIDVLEFQDQTLALRDRLGLITANGIAGLALVLLFLALVLDLRLAFWISIGIATAFLGGFILSSALGVTLNGLVLFGLLVAIGLVVDDAIVVGEAIDTARATGTDPKRAALDGLKSVRAPVFVGVATTIAAFSPLLLASGELAEMIRHIPIVVITTLIVSLIEAFFILPSHLSHAGNWSKPPLSTIQTRLAGLLDDAGRTIVAPLVHCAARARYAALAIAALTIYFAVLLVQNDIVRVLFFPDIEPDVVSVSVTLPNGSTYDATAEAVEQLKKAAQTLSQDLEAEYGKPVIRSLVVTKGGRIRGLGAMFGDVGFSTAEHYGSMQLELIPSGERRISATQIASRWRDLTGPIAAAREVEFSSTVANFGADISFGLAAPDDGTLQQAAADLADSLGSVDGVQDISLSAKDGKREYLFSLTPAGEASGLTTRDLAKQMRQAFFGEEIDRIQRGREELIVNLRYSNAFAASPEALERMRVRLPDGSAVPLLTVATIKEGRSPQTYTRVDGQRVTTVTANVNKDITTPDAVNTVLLDQVLPQLAKRYPGLQWTESGAAEAQKKDLESIAKTFAVVVVVIYGIVAVQLRSYFLPIAILFTVPIALAGAIFAHALLGMPLSFLSLFGVIALAGVSVNASIVLMDDYLQQLSEGVNRITAAAQAAQRRFRPILLTTLTTALGLAPIISETSPQAQFLVPIAVSLGGGILFCGAFVLFTTPAVALIIEDVMALRARKHQAPQAAA